MDAQKNGYARKTKAELIAELEAADRDLHHVTAQNDYKRGRIARLAKESEAAEKLVIELGERVESYRTKVLVLKSMKEGTAESTRVALLRKGHHILDLEKRISKLETVIELAQNSFKAALK